MSIIAKAEDFLVEVRVNTDPVATPPDVPNGTKIFWNDGGIDRVYIKTQSGVSETGAAGESTTASNVGGGSGIFKQLTGTDLEFKTLIPGSNISFLVGADTVTIEAAATGETNDGQNLGAGAQVFALKSGVNLRFRSLVAGSGITLTQNTNDITIEASGGGGITIIPDLGSVSGTYDGDLVLLGSATMTSFTTVRGDLLFLGTNSVLDDTSGNFLRVEGDVIGPSTGYGRVDHSTTTISAPSSQYMGNVINVDIYTYNSGTAGNAGAPITIKGSFIGPERSINSHGSNVGFPSSFAGAGGNITIGGDCICKEIIAYGGSTTGSADQNAASGATVTIGGNLRITELFNDALLLQGGNVGGSGGGRGGTSGSLYVGGNFYYEGQGTARITGGNSSTGDGGFTSSVTVRGNTSFSNENGTATLDMSAGFGGNGAGGSLSGTITFNGFVNVNGFVRANGGQGFNGNGGNSVSNIRFLGGVRITTLEMRGGAASVGFADGRSSNDALFEGGGYIFNLDLLENNSGGNRSTQNTATTLSRGHYQINKVTRVDKALRTPRQRLILRDCVASFGELVDPVTGQGDDALTKPTNTPTADQTPTQVSESIYKADTSDIRRSTAFTTL